MKLPSHLSIRSKIALCIFMFGALSGSAVSAENETTPCSAPEVPLSDPVMGEKVEVRARKLVPYRIRAVLGPKPGFGTLVLLRRNSPQESGSIIWTQPGLYNKSIAAINGKDVGAMELKAARQMINYLPEPVVISVQGKGDLLENFDCYSRPQER